MEDLYDHIIRVKKDHDQLVRDNAIRIKSIFNVRLCETVVEENSSLGVYFRLEPEELCIDPTLYQQVQVLYIYTFALLWEKNGVM